MKRAKRLQSTQSNDSTRETLRIRSLSTPQFEAYMPEYLDSWLSILYNTIAYLAARNSMINGSDKELKDPLKSKHSHDQINGNNEAEIQTTNNQTALAELARTISEVAYGVVQVIIK